MEESAALSPFPGCRRQLLKPPIPPERIEVGIDLETAARGLRHVIGNIASDRHQLRNHGFSLIGSKWDGEEPDAKAAAPGDILRLDYRQPLERILLRIEVGWKYEPGREASTPRGGISRPNRVGH